MGNIIILNWKEFNVDLDKVRKYLLSNLSNNYDGLLCDESCLTVIFKEEYSTEDIDIVTNYWNNLNSHSFDITMDEYIDLKLNQATQFGLSLIKSAAKENMLMGITQAGKTRQVSNYLERMQTYLQSGSLYAAIDEINELIANGLPSELSPFITEVRLLSYKSKIQGFLS